MRKKIKKGLALLLCAALLGTSIEGAASISCAKSVTSDNGITDMLVHAKDTTDTGTDNGTNNGSGTDNGNNNDTNNNTGTTENNNTKEDPAFTGEIVNGIYTLTKCETTKDSVIVPLTVEGNTVTALKGTFHNCWPVKTVYLPDSITTIGAETFSDCGLTAIYHYSNDATQAVPGLPTSLLSIGENAFKNCGITDITISAGSNLTSIDSGAFNISKIKNFTVEAGASVGSIGTNAFTNSTLENFVIHGNVTTIADGALASVATLKNFTVTTFAAVGTIGTKCCENSGSSDFNVTFQGRIETIGDNAFTGSGGIQNLFIANCGSIGSYAFSPCNIRNIVIDGSIGRIGDYAFALCGNVDSIHVVSSTDYTLGKYAFYCATIREVDFGPGLTVIEEGAFAKCGHLETVLLPDTLQSIGDGAFEDVATIKTFVVRDDLTLSNSVFGVSPQGDTLTTLQNSTNTYLKTLYGTDTATLLKLKKAKYNKKKGIVKLKWTKAAVASGYAIYTKTIPKGKKAGKVKWKKAKLIKKNKNSAKLKLKKKQRKILKKKGKMFFAVASYTVTVNLEDGVKQKNFSDKSNKKKIKK